MAQALCKHFGLCGGCSFQDVPYAEQLAGKEKRIAVKVIDHRGNEVMVVREMRT